MVRVDAGWRRVLCRWRVVGVLGVCLIMTPVWMLLTPVGWASMFCVESARDLVGAVVTLGGSLAVGALFLLLTHLRGKPPSAWFALALPGVGIAVSGILAMVFDSHGPWLSELGFYWVAGAVWLYGIAAVFALPAAFAHTALMLLVAREAA